MIKIYLMCMTVVSLSCVPCVAQGPLRNAIKRQASCSGDYGTTSTRLGIISRIRGQAKATCGSSMSASCSGQAMVYVPAPAPACLTGNCGTPESPEVASLGMRRNEFRQSLMKAVGNAHRNGDITILQYFAISRSSLNPAKLAEIQEAVRESAVQEGLVSGAAIDWDGLISFIERLLPIIIKLIDLLGYNMTDVKDFYVTTEGSTLIMNDGFTFFIGA